MKLLLFLAMLPLLAGTTAGRTDEQLPAPGRHRLTLTLEDGKQIRYSLSMPEPTTRAKAPLVLALHYGGEVTPWCSMPFIELLAGPAFEPMGAIIIAPDCPGRGWADPLSEQAAMALVCHALAHWPTDPGRVAVTGFSMGGMGTWHLAATRPDVFSAALPVAGIPGSSLPAIPLYAIHSRRDEVVEMGPSKQGVREMKKKGIEAKLVVLEEGPTHYNTAAFAPALRRGAKWLEKLWAGKE